jgi:hypothetical protein
MRDFLSMGFGIALLFYLPLSLVENLIWSLVILIKGEKGNSPRALFWGTLGISSVSALIAFRLIGWRPWGPSDLLPLIMAGLWAWYFILVPQLVIRWALTKWGQGCRSKMVILRIVFTVVLPMLLYLAHGGLGLIAGISSD